MTVPPIRPTHKPTPADAWPSDPDIDGDTWELGPPPAYEPMAEDEAWRLDQVARSERPDSGPIHIAAILDAYLARDPGDRVSDAERAELRMAP